MFVCAMSLIYPTKVSVVLDCGGGLDTVESFILKTRRSSGVPSTSASLLWRTHSHCSGKYLPRDADVMPLITSLTRTWVPPTVHVSNQRPLQYMCHIKDWNEKGDSVAFSSAEEQHPVHARYALWHIDGQSYGLSQ